MPSQHSLGGKFTLKGSSMKVNRMGFGGIHLTGHMAWGEPKDRQGVMTVLREAVSLGINHIDTSDYYGPHIANQIIKDALHPYPSDLVIGTKIGVRRGSDKSWPKALSAEELTSAVHDNLRNLCAETLDVVNLRCGEAQSTNEDSIAEPLRTLVKLKEQGLVRAVGLSNVSYKQFKESESIADVVSVQNHYNLDNRHDDELIDELASKRIAFVPFFPVGGFRPIQSVSLEKVAASLGATSRQVALAWLLHRSPNILVIAGTSSVPHLRENVEAASLDIPLDIMAELDQVSQMKGR